MAWPPTNPTTNVVISSATTNIVWGTAGFEVANFASVIVKSIKVKERTEQIKVEQGSGLEAVNVILRQGLDYEITVVDDSGITFPIVGQDNVTLVCPQMGSNGVSTTSNVIGICTNNDYQGTRKVEGERVLMFQTFNLIPSI